MILKLKKKHDLIDKKQKLQRKTFHQNFYQPSHLIELLNKIIMASWFCSSLCQTSNQTNNQIVLVNTKTNQIIKYGNSLQAKNSSNLQSNFIMIRKSLYDAYLETCQKQEKPFVDEEFPPTQQSISENNLNQLPMLRNKSILWQRIPDLYNNSTLIKGKVQLPNIQQGNLGDCYFLAAISALAKNQNNILRIFGKKSLRQLVKNQYGIYKLVINLTGQPQQIVIDDFIPVFAMSKRPVFCKPVNNEFWVVLLQKVWAKINKSYRNIAYGNPHQVLKRFSIAPVFLQNIPQQFYRQGKNQFLQQINQFEVNLWQQILEGQNKNFPMCCGSRQKVNLEGIKSSYSYPLLSAYQILDKNTKIKLLELGNPWGYTENTDFSAQKSEAYNALNSLIKNQVKQKQQKNGIFLISFEMFLANFESINISHCRPEYNYVFKPVTLIESEPQFYRITAQKDGQVYITFQKQYLNNQKSSSYKKNGVISILIAEEVHKNKFQYVDCALQTSLSDVNVRCKRLKSGSYAVMIRNRDAQSEFQSNFYLKSKRLGTLSIYSESAFVIQQILKVQGFWFDFFQTHALKYNKDKMKIGPFENDWIAKKLIPSSGFGYICINLDNKGSKKFLISINQNSINQEGFKLHFPPQVIQKMDTENYPQFHLEVCPGYCLVFLFEIDFIRQSPTLSFPPKGFDIKKII